MRSSLLTTPIVHAGRLARLGFKRACLPAVGHSFSNLLAHLMQ